MRPSFLHTLTWFDATLPPSADECVANWRRDLRRRQDKQLVAVLMMTIIVSPILLTPM